MLKVAKRKANAANADVRWIQADALNTTLRNEECDAVWLISTLHYFAGKRQKLLFQEIYRILRPGGVVLADTEFAEQHPSLWVVEYFPSLRERFKDACLSVEQYRTWLQEIGFSNIRFEHRDYGPDERDAFLRIGQRCPEKYLDPRVRDGLPAFQEMKMSEADAGLKKLKMAIEDRSIKNVIESYQARATMPGDIGLIIAKK